MTCIGIPEPVQTLLTRLSDDREVPVGSLDHRAASLAISYGWVYEYQGQMSLTGAGAYHAGKERGERVVGVNGPARDRGSPDTQLA